VSDNSSQSASQVQNNYSPEENGYDYAAIIIGIIYGIAITFLVILTAQVYNLPNSTFLFFGDDSSTFSLEGGNVNLIVTNLPDTPKKVLHIEAPDGVSGFNIFSIGLFDDGTGSEINSTQISFNNKNPLVIEKIEPNDVTDIDVIIDSKNAGLYLGNFQISINGNVSAIPITFEVKSNPALVFVWILNGIAVSVGALNFIGYYFLVKEQNAIVAEAASKANEVDGYLTDPMIRENLPAIADHLTSTVAKLQQSKPRYAKEDLMRVNTLVKGGRIVSPRGLLDSNVTGKKGEQAQTTQGMGNPQVEISEKYETIIRKNEQILNKGVDFKLRNYTTSNIVEKKIVSGITGIAFGIVVGFMPLVGGDFVSNIRTIGLVELFTLLGFGIAVGSLNETIGKIWETARNGKDGDGAIEGLKIIDKDPSPDKTDVKVNDTIRVFFNRQIDRDTLTSAFTLREYKTKENLGIENETTEKSRLAILRPKHNFEVNKKYIVTISKKVKDLKGIGMASDETWSFQTS
jgi:hypothetical protein